MTFIYKRFMSLKELLTADLFVTSLNPPPRQTYRVFHKLWKVAFSCVPVSASTIDPCIRIFGHGVGVWEIPTMRIFWFICVHYFRTPREKTRQCCCTFCQVLLCFEVSSDVQVDETNFQPGWTDMEILQSAFVGALLSSWRHSRWFLVTRPTTE